MGRSWDGRNRLLRIRCKRSASEEEEDEPPKGVDLGNVAGSSKIRRLAHSGRNWRIRMGDKEEDLNANAGTGSPVESGSLGKSEFKSKTCHISGKTGSQTEKINNERQEGRRPENMEFTTPNNPEAKQKWKPYGEN